MAFNYEIIKHIATLSETQDESKQVNIISYNNAKPKIDIRNWFENNKMGKGITLDEQEWEILGSCFKDSLSDDIDYESEIVLDQEQRNISFSIQFKVGETKVMKYVDFLNAVNKYFSEYRISANAFVDFVDEEPIIKIIANIPLCLKVTEPMLDALEDFLSKYADDINEMGAISARQLYFENVIVIGDRSSCMHEDHTTEELLVSIDFVKKNGDIVKVETMASYCEKCNLFFMRQHDYRLMKAKAGNARMLCQETEREKYCNFSKYDLNDHSILNVYGYTVNATDDLSDKQRQEILANIVDREILTKDRVAAYLAYFIRLSENRSSDLSVAIDKWNRDRKFILDYKVGSRRKVEPIKITVIKYKPL